MEEASMKIIKFLIFAFNLVIFIVGLVFIIGGAVLSTKFKDYFAFFGNEINTAAVFVIIIGVLCLVVGFFGCWGAFRENHCMIISFSVFLGIILALEIGAASTAFVLRTDLEKFVRHNMKLTIPQYQGEGVQDAWDHLQKSLTCCGVNSFTDWKQNAAFSNASTVPQSCCIDPSVPNCAGNVLQTNDTSNIHDVGCADDLISWAKDNIAVIGTITIVFAVIQVSGIVLACILGAAMRKKYQPM